MLAAAAAVDAGLLWLLQGVGRKVSDDGADRTNDVGQWVS